MAYVKVSFSLEDNVVQLLRRNATLAGKPLSRYLAELIEEDERRRRERLAVEGYQELARDSLLFARDAQALATDLWPSWEEE